MAEPMESFFRYYIDFPVPCDVCSYTVLQAIDMLPTPIRLMTYYLKCSREDVFWAYLAITPIEGVHIEVEREIGYDCCEWSLELRCEHFCIIAHSAGC